MKRRSFFGAVAGLLVLPNFSYKKHGYFVDGDRIYYPETFKVTDTPPEPAIITRIGGLYTRTLNYPGVLTFELGFYSIPCKGCDYYDEESPNYVFWKSMDQDKNKPFDCVVRYKGEDHVCRLEKITWGSRKNKVFETYEVICFYG